MELLLKNWKDILIAIVLAILVFQTCSKPKTESEKPKIETVSKSDTAWKSPQQPAPIINVYPTATQTIPYQVKSTDTKYVPDTNYEGLLKQYKQALDSLLATKVYDQTYKQDSSSITLKDTVRENKIIGRSYKFDLKYPVITNTTTTTITLPYKPKSILYIGGGVNGSQITPIQSFDAGLMFKDKKDHLYGGKVGMGANGITYGVQSYWPIKLR